MTPRAAWLTTATLLTAMVMYVLSAGESDLVLLLIPVAAGVRFFGYQKVGALAPPWVVAVLTFAAVFYAAFHVLASGPQIWVLAEFVAVLAVIKSLERWSARDDLQIILVSIFLVLASIVASSTLLVGLIVLLFVPLLTFSTMALQIEGALSFGDPDADRIERSRLVRRTEERGAGFGPIVGIFTSSFVLILSIAVVAFVLLPRGIGSDTIGGLTRPVIGRATGFRNTVELGRGGLISNDQTIVMEVEILNPRTGYSMGATGRVFHLRGTALGTYDNGNWTRFVPEGQDRFDDYTVRQAGLRYDFKGNIGQADVKQIIHLTPNASDSGILFSVWTPLRISFSEAIASEIAVDNRARTASLTDSKSRITKYEVLSRATTGRRLEGTLTRTPASFENQAIRAIAEGVLQSTGIENDPWLRSIADDRLAAEAIEQWLAFDGGFAYTLDVPIADPDRDPIEWFLTDAKTGHCEYFASAMAAMCRAVGINSRVITGYMLGEYDTSRERYIVRRSNAHAWVEIEIAPGIWTTFDPTPNVTAMHVPDAGNMRLLRKLLDAVDGFWLSSVVSFDESSQMKLLGMEHLARDSVLADRQLMNRGKKIMRVVFLLLIAGLAVLLVFRWYRKPVPLRIGSQRLELPAAALLARRRLIRFWEHSGRPRPTWSGLVAHSGAHLELELAELLTATAFGHRSWGETETRRAHDILDELELAHKQASPRTRAPHP